MSIINHYIKRLGNIDCYHNFQRERAERYKRVLNNADIAIENKSILEIGCGTGGIISSFNGKINVGIDLERKRLLKGRMLSRNPKTMFIYADGEMLPFESETFDIVLLLDVIEHVKNPEYIISECSRLLRKGGILCVNFPPYYSAFGGHLILPYLHYLPRGLSYFILKRLLLIIGNEENQLLINYPLKVKQHESLNKISTQELKMLIKQYFRINVEIATTIFLGLRLRRYPQLIPEFLCSSKFFLCRKIFKPV